MDIQDSIVYVSPEDKQKIFEQNAQPYLVLNAWNVQNIVFELIKNFMLSNDPADLGIPLAQRYHEDPTKSQIFIDIAYNWRKDQKVKRPAIFIERSPVSVTYPTMGYGQEYNVKESEETKLTFNAFTIKVTCLGTILASTEMLAEYVKQALVSFRKEIQRDFRLRRFQPKSIGSPKNLIEGQDHFGIELEIDIVYDEGWIVKGDDLKLKTVANEIYGKVTSKPLTNQ